MPTRAFGYEFTHIPEHVRADVESLEREGVLYADHWVEELQDFRHVRIALTADEAKDYDFVLDNTLEAVNQSVDNARKTLDEQNEEFAKKNKKK